MKIIALFVSLILLLSISSTFGDVSSNCETGGCHNGRLLDNLTEEAKEIYLMGVLNSLNYTDKKRWMNLYPNATWGDIMEAVILYYKQNPTKKHRPIVEVILSGCK